MSTNPLLACDFYKTGHITQYPENTQLVYSNFTPRSSRLAHKLESVFDEKIVFFGLQRFIKSFLIESFNNNFFYKSCADVVNEYKRQMDNGLGVGAVDTQHVMDLWKLGYLPISIKALPEGSRVNMQVPVLTIVNTHPDFFWLPNYLESVMSAELWKGTTTASTAHQYRKLLEQYAEKTGANKDFILWQGHDFSMRGLSGVEDCAMSGGGHLLSFLGTDSIPAIEDLEKYYSGRDTFVGGSVPATEHSVMCMGGMENEIDTFRRLITDVYPSGVVSIVSDSWDYWKVITEYAQELKEEILSRKENAIGLAKVVFRPDSGDPADILCGTFRQPTDAYKAHHLTPEQKGSVECLWEIFGGTVNAAGYKELNPRVGLIYGDSITLERAQDILQRLEAKDFASSNVVFGIGSYTYQYVTRDSYGFAMKATFGVVDGEDRVIFKDPKTGAGKKSAKGLLRVEKEGDDFVLYDNQTREQEKLGCLREVFRDGELLVDDTLENIRKTLNG
jgi:nicotinamide phosphoribosyltransferase